MPTFRAVSKSENILSAQEDHFQFTDLMNFWFEDLES